MKICIYGASSETIDQIYLDEMECLAGVLARNGHALVFGGGSRGMMGAAARGFAAEGGEIIGVAPSFFTAWREPSPEMTQDNKDRNVLYQQCTELILTDTMRERKQKMEELSDAFLAAPGGIGTFDEFFEILTLRQLHQHNKPVILYNMNGFYDPLIAFLEDIAKKNFMRTEETLYHVCTAPEEVVDLLMV